MKCPRCQSDNSANARFCRACGVGLENVCPGCGSRNAVDSSFCDQCGHDLRRPVIATPVDQPSPRSDFSVTPTGKPGNRRGSLQGERKLVTVLFADASNFTSLSERLDPDEIHQIMDGCFHLLNGLINRYGGTTVQFTGDGVMAIFGAPTAHEDHAQRACRASLEIQRSLEDFGYRIEREFGVEFKMRIGVNSGLVVVTSIGDERKMDYTALGEAINLASRMEALAEPGAVLASSATYRLARDFFEFKSLGEIRIKGKKEPQQVFELLKAKEIATHLEAAAARGLTRFVGRQSLLAVLHEAYRKASGGAGQVVDVVGEAGIGKSRLLLEFRSQLTQDEFTYLEGHCVHYGATMAYLPILDILRSCFNIDEGEREAVIRKRVAETTRHLDEKLDGVLPALQDLLSLKVNDAAYLALEPKLKRERIFEALRDLFLRKSEQRPIILAIEDLHWIDKTSEEFLDYLIGWLPSAKVMLIVLHRPEYAIRWSSKSYFNRIGVDQLTPASSGELVQAILEDGEVALDLQSIILYRAAGNPLFVEELTSALMESGAIQRKGNSYVLKGGAPVLNVPDTIQGIIAGRIDGLEGNLKRIMQVASVIGREFAFRILHAIIEMREQLKVDLVSLQNAELIYEKSLFPELQYTFKHALIQEVAYSSLLVQRRKEIHERIGNAVEALYPERLSEHYAFLAYHYGRAENAVKALKYLKLAAENATRDNSLWEALGFYKESLTISRKLPETVESKKDRLAIILAIATLLERMGYPEDPGDIHREGESISVELSDFRATSQIHNFIGVYLTAKGHRDTAITYLERSYSEAEKADEIGLMAVLANGLWKSYIGEGKYAKIVEIAPGLIRGLEETHAKTRDSAATVEIYPSLLSDYGLSLAVTGNFESGEEYCRKGVFLATQAGHLFNSGWGELCYGFSSLTRGRSEAAIEHLKSGAANLEKSQGILFLPSIWAFLGHAYLMTEDVAEAMNCIEKGFKIQAASGVPLGLSYLYSRLSLVNMHSADYAEAFANAKRALGFAQAGNELHNQAVYAQMLGLAGWKSRELSFQDAEESIRRGIKIEIDLHLGPYEAVGYFYLGELFTDVGDRENALENLKRAKQMTEEMGMDYWLERTRKLIGVADWLSRGY